MIRVLVTARARYTVDRYLASWGRRFLFTIRPVPYERFLRAPDFRPGVYLFTDIDRLDDPARARADELWERLRETPGCSVLNRPRRVLRRHDLLAALHARGVNTFRAHRADGDLGAVRFPAFLRVEDDHDGPRSGLLRDAKELSAALAATVASTDESRGPRPRWLVVEYCDASDGAGVHRKYGAFRVGARVIPRHVFAGGSWCLKHADSVAPEHLREEMAYLEENPHRDRLLDVFDVAGVEYGRIDYGVVDGRVQVWEINTNPMILTPANARDVERRAAHQWFSARLADAWRELDRGAGGGLGVPSELLRTLAHVGHEALLQPRRASR